MKVLVPRASESGPQADLAKFLESYVRVLREHIRIEEEKLFPEVERTLAPATRARITEEFERIEEAKVGPYMHGMFHRMIEELAGAYGVGEPVPSGGD